LCRRELSEITLRRESRGALAAMAPKGPPRNKQIEFDVEALAQQGAFSTTYSSYFEKTERR